MPPHLPLEPAGVARKGECLILQVVCFVHQQFNAFPAIKNLKVAAQVSLLQQQKLPSQPIPAACWTGRKVFNAAIKTRCDGQNGLSFAFSVQAKFISNNFPELPVLTSSPAIFAQ